LEPPSSSEQKPITKKEACEILNIAYNTQRLNKIIDDFLETRKFREKRRAQNKGRPASDVEIKSIAESYLEGSSIAEISKSLFRSANFVKSVIERIGIPAKKTSESQDITFLPEECVSETFEAGEIVWSARYNSAAKVVKEETNMDYEQKYGSKCYRVYVMKQSAWEEESYFGEVSGGFFASQPAHDLGKLNHLKQYGLNLNRLEGTV